MQDTQPQSNTDLPVTEALDEVLAQSVAERTSKEKTNAKQGPSRKKKKKQTRSVPRGRIYIQATYNNTIVTVTDEAGNVLGWSSAGHVGFKGPKKSTSYAAGIVVRDVFTRLQDVGMREAAVFVKGLGSGREAAIRALNVNGIDVLAIKDVTPIPHNGPRPPKVRRV